MKWELRERILFDLLSHGYGAKNTLQSLMSCKGFPKHEIKKVKSVIDELIAEGYLILKPTGHDPDISIN